MSFTYGITAGMSAAYFTGSSAITDLVPTAYHGALNGHPFLIDTKSQDFIGPVSIPALAPQSDQSTTGGLASLNRDGVIPRNFTTWHHGAGQTWHDNDDSDPARFRTSSGIDPWTKNRLTLLPSTNVAATPTNATCALVTLSNGWRYYYDSNDGLVYRSQTANGSGTASFSSTTVTGNSTSGGNPLGPYRSICTDGTNVYVVSSIDGAALAVKKIGTGGTTTHFSGGDAGNPNFIAWVKGRLVVGHTTSSVQKVYDITSGSVGSTITVGDANAVMLDAVEAGSYIWLGTRSATVSRIYRIAADSSTGALTLDGVGLTLPSGEQLRSVFGYQSFVFVGTNLGWRCCQVDGTTLTMGPLVAIGARVECWTARGQYVWFGWTGMDTTTGGLGRIDLGSFVDTLTPAYAADITTVTGEVINAALVTINESNAGDLTRPIVQFVTSTLWVETDNSDFVSSGTITAGYVNYGITDPKTAIALEVRNEPIVSGTTITAAIANHVGGTTSPIDSINAQGSTGQTMTINNVAGAEHEITLTMTSSGANAPAVTNMTLRARPAPQSGRFWVIPMVYYEKLKCLDNVPRPFDISAELDYLHTLRSPSSTPISFQLGGVTETVFLDDYEFHPHHLTEDRRAWNGTCVVKLKDMRPVTL